MEPLRSQEECLAVVRARFYALPARLREENNYTLLDPATGMALDWELTDEEAQSVQDGAAQWFADDEEPDLERG